MTRLVKGWPLASLAIGFLAGPAPAHPRPWAGTTSPAPADDCPGCSLAAIFNATPEQRARWAAEHARAGRR